MLTPEVPTAAIDTIDVRVILTGAPDLESSYGQPFIAEKAYVYTDAEAGAVFTVVSGRAILKNRHLGRSTRHRSYSLKMPAGRQRDDAPSWLVHALQAAGVTW